MPDTKAGRERKGRNKRAQLEARLARREKQVLDGAEPDADLEQFWYPDESE
jgi:hypothetical protein